MGEIRHDSSGALNTVTTTSSAAGAVHKSNYSSNNRHPLIINLTGPVTISKTGLTIPHSLSLSVWERIGRELASLSDSSAWWLADWLIFGETAYSGRYREVIEQTGLGYQTLRNYAWVARRFEHARRRECLSFAHHAEVASLEPAEQDYWLRRAEEQKWSRNRLRAEVQSSLAERKPDGGPGPSGPAAGAGTPSGHSVAIHVMLPPEAAERCELVATAHGLSVDAWVAQVVQSAVSAFEESTVPDRAG